ncbi:hypothetical protein V5799_002240 [Amblyomma americanum]|uniref:Uncharacterized protein n=1 Tax=Amblyomma americanum TaxID=6943 RepID=A0AAQ4CXW7_AMBAM
MIRLLRRVQEDFLLTVQLNSFMAVETFLALTSIIDSSMNIYIKAYTHAAPMFIGMIFGCLAVRRNQLSRLIQGAAWALVATVSLAALLGVRTWFDGRPPERLESAFYAGLHRASWSLGASWVMYTCATGHGGFVNKILA